MSTATASGLAGRVQEICRTLRAAGMPVGPAQVIDALVALEAVGVERRDDARAALSAVLVKDPKHFPLFAQAFDLFFGRASHVLAPPAGSGGERKQEESRRAFRRLSEALGATATASDDFTPAADRSATASHREVLARKDFEQMSLAELAQARELLERGIPLFDEVPTRRYRPAADGRRYDLSRSMRMMLRNAGEIVVLARRRRRLRPPPLVLICDISGSMSRYSRMFLHFAHALAARRHEVHCFVFATRLTNVTRRLRDRDVDRALANIAEDVVDWDSGTRIGECLRHFNMEWGRRVLGRNATVLLLSDGLECDPESDLEFQMERLKLSCRQLVWLNPMLRYEKFEPRASGIRRMLPHVDLFVPAHNVVSLHSLAQRLADPHHAYDNGARRAA